MCILDHAAWWMGRAPPSTSSLASNLYRYAACTCIRLASTHRCTDVHPHTCTHTHLRTHARMHTHERMRACTHAHAHTCPRAYTCPCAGAHAGDDARGELTELGWRSSQA